MKEKPKIGSLGIQRYRVETEHVIEFADDQLPAVLSTPVLIGFLERTARHTLRPFLDENETSLGVEIDLAHLAPTPLGATIECVTRIVHVEGRRVSFQVEARDEQEPIARGFHKRMVILKDRFARHVARKSRSG